jgi:hypothetical protein
MASNYCSNSLMLCLLQVLTNNMDMFAYTSLRDLTPITGPSKMQENLYQETVRGGRDLLLHAERDVKNCQACPQSSGGFVLIQLSSTDCLNL